MSDISRLSGLRRGRPRWTAVSGARSAASRSFTAAVFVLAMAAAGLAQPEPKHVRELVSSGKVSQVADRLVIQVEDPRPLGEAIWLLEQKFGWWITYEDPPYLADSDMWDVTAPEVRAASPTRRAFVPRANPIRLEFPLPPSGAPESPRSVLEALLDRNREAGNPGVFRVLESGAMYHVVPVATRDRRGSGQRRAGQDLWKLGTEDHVADALHARRGGGLLPELPLRHAGGSGTHGRQTPRARALICRLARRRHSSCSCFPCPSSWTTSPTFCA